MLEFTYNSRSYYWNFKLRSLVMTYIAVDSDTDLFIHIFDTHNGMSHAKIVKIHVHRTDGTFQMCSRCGRVKTVV